MSTSASADPTSDQQRPPRRNPHAMGTFTSMVLSTVVVTAVVLAFFALVARPDTVARPSVDVPAVVTEARRSTGWQLSQVDGLGEGWVANSARLEPEADGLRTWHVGYVKDQEYVALDQTAKATDGWVTAQTKGRAPAGVMTVGGVPLDSYTDPRNGDCTLVRRGGDALTSVIETTGTCAEAAAQAQKLSPALR
ncbi:MULTISPECIES: DUF4245 family protein [Arsenicicoccus]|uniref:DUF4245 family protein n=1 Tax=Arsenicicoccus TaxID=267408 RepID=UPI002579EEB2|nr:MULTISPECIES: DUF4245 family protein [Arsenicicoccus]